MTSPDVTDEMLSVSEVAPSIANDQSDVSGCISLSARATTRTLQLSFETGSVGSSRWHLAYG